MNRRLSHHKPACKISLLHVMMSQSALARVLCFLSFFSFHANTTLARFLPADWPKNQEIVRLLSVLFTHAVTAGESLLRRIFREVFMSPGTCCCSCCRKNNHAVGVFGASVCLNFGVLSHRVRDTGHHGNGLSLQVVCNGMRSLWAQFVCVSAYLSFPSLFFFFPALSQPNEFLQETKGQTGLV